MTRPELLALPAFFESGLARRLGEMIHGTSAARRGLAVRRLPARRPLPPPPRGTVPRLPGSGP